MDEFKWNNPGRSTTILPQPVSRRDESVTVDVKVGRLVVEMASTISKLRKSYLSANERFECVQQTKDSYLALQRVNATIQDKTTRAKLTTYLVVVGSLGVYLNEECEMTLLDAIAHRKLDEWGLHFYTGSHSIGERDGEGHDVQYHLTEEMLVDEQVARGDLLRWLERED